MGSSSSGCIDRATEVNSHFTSDATHIFESEAGELRYNSTCAGMIKHTIRKQIKWLYLVYKSGPSHECGKRCGNKKEKEKRPELLPHVRASIEM